MREHRGALRAERLIDEGMRLPDRLAFSVLPVMAVLEQHRGDWNGSKPYISWRASVVWPV